MEHTTQDRDEIGLRMNLESTVVLVGSATCAQATTCASYMRQTWPSSGLRNLQLINKAIRDYEQETGSSTTPYYDSHVDSS